jgi:putative membrane protein
MSSMSKNSHRFGFAALATLLALGSAAAQTPGSATNSNSSGSNTGGSSGYTNGSAAGDATQVPNGALVPESAMDAAQLSAGDSRFLEDAAQAGMTEVQLGQLAVQKGTNADVKSFGQKMVDDHTTANNQLKALATQKGVTLPRSPSAMQKADVDRLSKMSGATFDRAFMDQMVKDHKKVVAAFDMAAKRSRDADVKRFAASTLPTLQGHLQMAQSLDSTVGGMQSK